MNVLPLACVLAVVVGASSAALAQDLEPLARTWRAIESERRAALVLDAEARAALAQRLALLLGQLERHEALTLPPPAGTDARVLRRRAERLLAELRLPADAGLLDPTLDPVERLIAALAESSARRIEEVEAVLGRAESLSRAVETAATLLERGGAEGRRPGAALLAAARARAADPATRARLRAAVVAVLERMPEGAGSARGAVIERADAISRPMAARAIERWAEVLAALEGSPDGDAAWLAWQVGAATDAAPDLAAVQAAIAFDTQRLRSECLLAARASGWRFELDPDGAEDDVVLARLVAQVRGEARWRIEDPDALLAAAALAAKRIDGGALRGLERPAALPWTIELGAVDDPFGAAAVPGDPRTGRAATVTLAPERTAAARRLLLVPDLLRLGPVGRLAALERGAAASGTMPRRDRTFLAAWSAVAAGRAADLGVASDPLDAFGALLLEMRDHALAAADVGLHLEGWDRARALAFLEARVPEDRVVLEAALDRVAAQPGRAAAAWTAAERLRSMRAEAERRLGAGFDQRAFHEAALGDGPVPLAEVQRRIDAWLRTLPGGNAYD